MKALLLLPIALPITAPLTAQPPSNRLDVFDAPSRHAWNLFLTVNHPAVDPTISKVRGVPDTTKTIGTPGTTVVWETWRLSETEVFLAGGAKPPEDWNDMSLPGSPASGKVPEVPKADLLTFSTRNPDIPSTGVAKAFNFEFKPMFDPNEGIFKGVGGFGESRMNKETYDFIVQNELYSQVGLRKYAADYVKGTKPPISFPVASTEVKAAWIEFTKEEVEAGKPSRFYIAEYKGKVYGLAALHIITKDIPNWFWCTFHHKEAPIPDAQFGHGIGNGDSHGQPSELKGTIWENYSLGGTQADFIESNGKETLLSDALIEKGFVESSCISCHARATISPHEDIQALGSFPVVGPPNPLDYFFPDATDPSKPGKPKLLQTDFLWSIPFRAK